MAQIDRAYVSLAIVLLIAGELLGFWMGIAEDNKLRTVHIAMLLPGFVTLAIYGCIYRLWPAMSAGPIAAVQFWLGVIGAIGIVVGSYQFVTTGGIAIVAPASAIAILGAAVLLWLFWTCSRKA